MKTALFIDGPNLYTTCKVLGIELDYRRLLEYYKDGLVRAYYYTAITEDEEFNNLRPLIDWLTYNGFSLVSKPTKKFIDPATGREKVKGNMDIEIAVDMLDLSPHIDRAVLFSGDGDFKPLVLSMQRRGVRCEVVSSIATKPPMCADELRRVADQFIDLTDIVEHITRGVAPARAKSKYASNG